MRLPKTILPCERECFLRVAHGDQVAFSEIFYHYTGKMHSFIKKMVRKDEVAEEIVQDVFVSMWRHRQKLLEVDNYAAYIFTIAANKTYNYLKSKAREEKKLNELLKTEKDFTNNTVEIIDLHETQELINQWVEELTPQKKLIYKLTREGGLSHDEIAQQLNISKNTAKNHLVQTLKYFRENLKKARTISILVIGVLIEVFS
jgi:RNA polymerase sigma-70 factor (ECF subfamily)